MGPLQGVLKLMPGIGSQLAGLDVDEGRLKRVEAIVLSMTPRERAIPHLIDGRRRQRIAMGSGSSVQEVSQLLEAPQGDGGDDGVDEQGQDAEHAFPASAISAASAELLPGPAPMSRPDAAGAKKKLKRKSEVVEKASAWQSSSGSHAWAWKKNPIYCVVAADLALAA